MNIRHPMNLALVLAGLALAGSALPAAAQQIDFGDNSSDFANDNECDDPRFAGDGMAHSYAEENLGRDAADCSRLFDLGQVRLARAKADSSISECKTVNFGTDASEWAHDTECDDPRFIGPGVHTILNSDDLGTDASDCRAACMAGEAWLR